ncbi:GspE/PulE family protein [Thioalkalivibrio thiocyanodenitrificans]|uniref:GspE/PulE family protein n=1 Tax=Thioalkalivibrio thiocyanodenitrificans TaxID=243063 RepID=UPI00037B0D0D|nr:GspE/PulE family protein [Thioalkalivibrio thiocyanodenitrificans]
MSQPQEPRKRLGEHLIERKLARPEAIEAALLEQKVSGEPLGLILVRNGFIRHRDLIKTILEVAPERIIGEQVFTTQVPAELLVRLRAMLIAETDDKLIVATLSPEQEVRSELAPYFPGLEILFVAVTPERLDEYLERLQSDIDDEGAVVDVMLRRALTENISDVHIIPRFASYTVLFRYLGVRHIAHEGSLEEYNTLVARIKDRARMDLAERRVPQDGGFQVEQNGKMVDMRVATLPSPDGEIVVIRLLDPDSVQPSLDGLGITRVDHWRSAVSRADGLCLICGPTGSGKTTTLNATIREMDRFGRAIYTAEDPVEYRMPFTGQININTAVGLDFSRSVRAFMRADPDVICLGEMRDTETARNAIKAAETGHLVLATLHTGSIRGAVDRVRDIGIESHELRYLLRGVLVQRLVRVICKSCNGEGCPECNGVGYSGRCVVSEAQYFQSVNEVDALIAGERSWPEMIEDAVLKCADGITDRREILRVFGAEAEPYLKQHGL